MTSIIRAQRIAERIREELSESLLHDVTDPALEGVTVTDVTVDRELAYAKIFVSALEGSERKEEILKGFERARGFLRHRLSQQISLRSFPQLRFSWDATAEKAERIEELFASLAKEKPQAEELEDDLHD